MGGKMSRNKGARGERQVIQLLQPIVDNVWKQFPDLGDAPKLQRNSLQSDSGGFDIVGLTWLGLEVKFQENLSLGPWWKQTVDQCGENQLPVLFYKKSRTQWKVMMRLYSDIGDGSKFFSKAIIDLESFLIFFEHRLQFELQRRLDIQRANPTMRLE